MRLLNDALGGSIARPRPLVSLLFAGHTHLGVIGFKGPEIDLHAVCKTAAVELLGAEAVLEDVGRGEAEDRRAGSARLDYEFAITQKPVAVGRVEDGPDVILRGPHPERRRQDDPPAASRRNSRLPVCATVILPLDFGVRA